MNILPLAAVSGDKRFAGKSAGNPFFRGFLILVSVPRPHIWRFSRLMSGKRSLAPSRKIPKLKNKFRGCDILRGSIFFSSDAANLSGKVLDFKVRTEKPVCLMDFFN
jgi:hypothetical protein